MNRDERKKIRTDGQQGHSGQENQKSDDYKRHIDGSIHVRGEIETKFPPDLIQKHDTERGEDSTREKKKFVIEMLTLLAVAVATLFTGFQACYSRQAYVNNREQFRFEQRPYISVDPKGGWAQDDTHLDNRFVFGHRPGEKELHLGVAINLENRGKTAAVECSITRTDLIMGTPEDTYQRASDYVPDYSRSTGRDVLAPNTVSVPQADSPVITDEQQKDFALEKFMIYVVGAVKYHDRFLPKTDYVTTYCFVLHHEGMAFANCAFPDGKFGNSMK